MNISIESDELGPRAELEYWKARMSKLLSITEQLKGKQCKIILGVLAQAKSNKLFRWKMIDNKITDSLNEAKDNVKYMHTLDQFEPLYKNDPVQIIAAVPGLINAIKMIHSIARYYNTSERMTALFVKVRRRPDAIFTVQAGKSMNACLQNR